MSSGEAAAPPRGPRRRLSEAERRAQILRATIEVVARRGFEAATMSSIAGHAGVSKGLVSHYFANKTDLLKQAVLETVRSIRDEMVAGVDLTAPVPDLLRIFIRKVASLRRDRPDDFRAMDRITTRLQAADGAPAFSYRDYEELYQGQESLFRRGQRDGHFRDFDPRVMAVTYQAAVDAMLGYVDTHSEVDAERYADQLTDILLAAMLRPVE